MISKHPPTLPSTDHPLANRLNVVIPTRDRGDAVTNTVRSIVASDVPPSRVIVVDQSSDDRTRDAMQIFCDDPSVAYLKTSTKGISAALNEGIRQAVAACVAITGDDCEVSPDWSKQILHEFDQDPNIAIVFGTILPNPSLEDGYFSPCYFPSSRVVVRSLMDKNRTSGTTACMALRKEVWEHLGGFDEMLGVGARLCSAEDTDFVIRSLIRGFATCETPAAVVVHKSRFEYARRDALIHRNWYGTGAAFAKAIKLGHLGILITLVRLAVGWTIGPSRIGTGMGPGGQRIATLKAFLAGAGVGLIQPISRQRGHFVERTE